MTEILRGDAPADLARAALLLRAGEHVAFPTETVYGLGADGLDERAVQGIFTAKGRPADNPLILHVASVAAALALWDTDATARARVETLAEAFWPGPLTLVLEASARVPAAVRAGLSSVAVRMPGHPIAQALIRAVDRPLAAPSANRSGRPSPTTAEHVLRTLDGRIAAVLDGGPTAVGVESTVLDLRSEQLCILREGGVSRARLEAAVGSMKIADPSASPVQVARSPGMRHRHYAPEGLSSALVSADALPGLWPESTALLCRACEALGARAAPVEILPDDPDGYAAELYAALYRLEASGARELRIADVPEGSAWAAVRDRIVRAAAG
ncbi:MAG: L-threonylcarbamoyladenylate synthase [Pseudomonadota bacterium]|nr:L-threonylcarbamoyladenylate synthase [Pseudomonadota bacterium]